MGDFTGMDLNPDEMVILRCQWQAIRNALRPFATRRFENRNWHDLFSVAEVRTLGLVYAQYFLAPHKFMPVGGEFPNTCRLCAEFRDSITHQITDQDMAETNFPKSPEFR